MSSKPAAAAAAAPAGDVELAKSRLVSDDAELSASSVANGSGVGPSSGSAVGSRLGSLWKDMFHEGMVRLS